MAVSPILDAYGRPIQRAELKREKSGPTVTGVRAPYSGSHPAAGLTPQRLAHVLRESIDGDPLRYLELAEDMEERDLHYLGVLGIRKRQVAGLEVTVEAASDDARDVAAADLVREVIERDSFVDEVIDVLDAIGKGFSVTEIIWDTSEGQWRPRALKFRDPRFFTFDPVDRETPLLREAGTDVPLAPGAYITHFAKVKSGLPIRGGLARAAAWSFLFKSFVAKDWAIFCEAYGQPLRLGKFGTGASQEDKDTLLRAVSSIGADYAAIIPESMAVEFVKADLSGSHDLYEKRANWLDQQVSKAVLGQTGTTDSIAGGYAVGKVHDGVRGDIEDADARQLAATLNRDLTLPLCRLNFGPLRTYPRIRIGRPDEVDVEKLVKNVAALVPLGLKVGMSTMRDKIGLPDPADDEELLGAPAPAPAPEPDPRKSQQDPVPPLRSAVHRAALSSRPVPPRTDAIDDAVGRILDDGGWEPLLEPLLSGLEARLAEVTTLAEAEALLADHLAWMGTDVLATKLAQATFAARLAGEVDDPLSDET
ncbi:MAG: hypothetical protein B7Y12_02130 [Rhizobiales bacterium 24-66-13]|jgi:phage gp29-like protein|nr:MAG: hypothetical protein B7Y61_01160 [Rhizobiales bacterium 35-66-30]OYZ82813.1 MAG: hypothetical protein B7Y12_02130 [Rhizobiales bacterium 24-66-13]OZB11846.1 MAG: hypothetical protein B7X67_02110 [Rhizobiales bacterium 39-66-18]HQS08729.1 DUF935 domain-containing protein [Xanthobacteraceae bacterium]HQS45930.1 DUF935 domain-containing protein [Xanthobacteraceae bacterium]